MSDTSSALPFTLPAILENAERIEIPIAVFIFT